MQDMHFFFPQCVLLNSANLSFSLCSLFVLSNNTPAEQTAKEPNLMPNDEHFLILAKLLSCQIQP